MDPNSSLPAGSLTHYALNQSESLESFSTSDLFAELIKRTCSGSQAESEKQAVLSHRLWTNLRNFSNVHLNRHSVAHLNSIYFALVYPEIGHRLPVKDATWVDLGC